MLLAAEYSEYDNENNKAQFNFQYKSLKKYELQFSIMYQATGLKFFKLCIRNKIRILTVLFRFLQETNKTLSISFFAFKLN